MATQGQDTFLTGGRGAGTPGAWNPASDAESWSQATGTTTTGFTGTQGTLFGVASNTIMFLGAHTVADIDVLCRVTNVSVADVLGVVARATASNTYYEAWIVSGNLHLAKFVAGTATELTGSPVAFTETAGQAYWVRVRCLGSTISAKVWQDGTTEPASWTVSATDTAITASGQFGIRGKPGNTTNAIAFDSFVAVDALPVLSTSPTTLSFSATAGGANPASQNSTLSETFGISTAWTSAITYGSGSGWLAISPTSGTLTASGNQIVAFSCTTGALAAGTYTATVTYTATTGGATATVGVTFTVTGGGTPALSTSPTTLSFATSQGLNPASQNSTLSETAGVGTAYTSAISYGIGGSGWLALAPASGTLAGHGNQIIAYTPTAIGLAVGTYTATVTLTATTGGATATVAVTLVVTLLAGINVLIDSASVHIRDDGQYLLDDSISSVSTLMCNVRDDTGTNHYTKGQPVAVVDSVHGTQYTGFVSTAVEDRVSPNPLIITQLGARDNHYLAEKRTYDGPEFTGVPAGAIACQMLEVLAQEGIVANFATDRDTTSTDFGAGVLTSVVGANNASGAGDLELALAGTSVTILEDTTAEFATGSLNGVTAAANTLAATATSAIKLVATCSQPGSTNAYTYMKIWAGSQAVGANETLSYDVFVTADSPTGQMGVDVLFTDGTNWRDTALIPDVQYVFPHPKNDVGPMGVGQWYHRAFFWGQYSGKTVQSVQVVCEGDTVGVYTGYFKNIQFSANPFTFSLNTIQQIGNNGYAQSDVSLVSTYNLIGAFRNSTAYSISAAQILQASNVSWTAQEPTGTLFVLKVSYDGGNVFHVCSNNQPLPNLPAGSTIAGVSLIFSEQFVYDPSVTGSARPGPEAVPVLSVLEVTVNPSYAATKTDVVYEVFTNADWAAGTFTNATNNGGSDLNLKQSTRNWDNGDSSSQTLFSASAATSPDRQAFHINVSASTEARSRLDFAGTIADGTMECDILLDSSANVLLSLVYRTTNWENHDASWGYAVEVTQTTMKLFKGPNSSTYSLTQIGTTASLNLSSGNWHRLKCVFVGSSHKAYLDDVLYINQTDATYSTGQVALRTSNGTASAYTAMFDNFGVISAGATLTGQWVSPSQSIAGAGTYGTSVVSWRDISSDPGNTDTLLVESTINGGTSWQACTNGQPIPNLTAGQSLSGISVKLRLTLTTTTASTKPGIDYVVMRVMSQLNASGTRVSPALSLSNVGRLGGSIVSWTTVALPTGCTLGVDVKIDAGAFVDITASPGGAIPGLNAQPNPTNDSFTTDTHTSYTNTSIAGGVAATWTYDTANSRISSSGGTGGLFIRTGVTSADIDEFIDMDQSDWGGVVWRYQNTSNYYELAVRDASNPTLPNTLQVFKVSAGVRSAIGPTNTAIVFPRGSYHRIRVTMLATQITVSFDGTQKIQFTDATITAAGLCGLRSDTSSGVSSARFYQLNIQPQGDDVSAHTIKTRLRLASTNPLASPQVTDLIVAVFGTTIQAGAVVPQTKYYHQYIDKNMDDLAKQSNYWWYLDKNRVPYFLPTNGLPAPWVGSSTPGWLDNGTLQADFQDASITVEDASDLYRNRTIVDNVLAPVTINEKRMGDGVSTSWTFGNQWAGAPTITVNGVAATVGVKNVDTGKQFYYAVGDLTIAEDTGGPLYDATFTLQFSGPGQFVTYSQYDNTAAQAARAAKEKIGTGIVTWVIDGTGLTKAQGDALAQSDVNQFSVIGRLLKATTRRYGLAPGQLFNVFLPEHGVSDGLFLVRRVQTSLTTEYGVQQGWYAIEAISGPDVGDWTRMYQRT